jgi:cell division septation protein DedD
VDVEKTDVAAEKTIRKEGSRVPAAAQKSRKPNQEEAPKEEAAPSKDPNLNVVEAVTKAEHKVVAAAKAEEKKVKKPAAKKEEVKKEEPKQMEVSMRPADKNEKVYIVQVGIFKVKANADALVKKLSELGFPVIARQDTKPNVGEITIVRLEPTPNKDEADKWVKDLKEKAGVSAVISKK